MIVPVLVVLLDSVIVSPPSLNVVSSFIHTPQCEVAIPL